MSKELAKDVRGLRLAISEKLVMINQLNKTRETSLAYTRLEEGFMFLGKVLAGLGEPNPYPKDSESKVNPKIADSADPNSVIMPLGNPIEQVKHVRAMIQEVIGTSVWNSLYDRFSGAKQPFVKYNNQGWFYVNYALASIMASKMWLGMELNNLVQGVDKDPQSDAGQAKKEKKEADSFRKEMDAKRGSDDDTKEKVADSGPDTPKPNDSLKEALDESKKKPETEKKTQNKSTAEAKPAKKAPPSKAASKAEERRAEQGKAASKKK